MVDEVELAKIGAIDDENKLETYLKDNPIEWSQLIALRIALRVFPLVTAPTDWATVTPHNYKQLCLSVWRAIHISALVIIRPDPDMRTAARTAAAATARATATATAHAHASVTSSVTFSARASARASATATATATAYAAAAAAADAGADVWISVRNDLYLLNSGEDLLRTELYQYVGNGASDERAVMMQPWHQSGVLDFAESPMVKDTPWQIISDWYLSLIDSDFHSTPWGEFSSDKDFEIALKPGDSWDGEPDDVMADIAEIVGWSVNNKYGNEKVNSFEILIDTQIGLVPKIIETWPFIDIEKNLHRYSQHLIEEIRQLDVLTLNHYYQGYEKTLGELMLKSPEDSLLFQNFEGNHREIMLTLSLLEDSDIYVQPILDQDYGSLGVTFAEDDDQIVIRAEPQQSDREVIETPKIKGLYPDIQRLANQFAEVGPSLDNQFGWAGIAHHSTRLATNLGERLEHVADHIVEIWSDLIGLASFWDMDKSLGEDDTSGIEPLDIDKRRKLEQLILTAVPFVRGFPTARELDDETREFQRNQEVIESARAVIEVAKSIELLRCDNAEFLIEFAKIAEKNGVHSDKAATSISQSAQNFIKTTALVLIPVYAATVITAAAPNSILIQRSKDFYLQSEKEIVQIIDELPNSLSTAYRILIDRLKQNEELPVTPKRPVSLNRSRREDDDKKLN